MMSKQFDALYTEIGLKALITSKRDTKILCLQRFVRFFAYGSSTLVLTLFLTGLGHTTEQTGLFMTLTLLGDVLISLILTTVADKIGRRRILALGALLMAGSGIVFAVFSQYWILVLASILGVISPRAIEESTISQLVDPIDRSNVIAWYTLFGTAGAALGSISIGWIINSLQNKSHWDPLDSYRVVFWIYAALGIVKFFLCLLLTEASEIDAVKKVKIPKSSEQRPLLTDNRPSENGQTNTDVAQSKVSSRLRSLAPNLSTHTIGLVFRLCLLFVMDSFGSGIATNSWMVFFFNTKFGLQEGKLGSLFFFTNILSAISNLGAASLARRIGLIQTMVFTHLPASVMLAVISLPNSEAAAMTLLLVRASVNSMDQAPRQAFLAAAVLPEERTVVMGIVNIVKTLSQAGGPLVTGGLAGINKLGVAFVIAGLLKCAYDLFMVGMFWSYKTVEDKAQAEVNRESEREAEEEGHVNP